MTQKEKMHEQSMEIARALAKRWIKGDRVYVDMYIGNSCLKMLYVFNAIHAVSETEAVSFMQEMYRIRRAP